MPRPLASPTRARVPRAAAAADGLRFALAMAAFLGALAFLYSTPALQRPLAPLDGWTARATAGLLAALGAEVRLDGAVLSHPGGFGFAVSYRCTGLVHAALLAVGLAALPGAARRRTRLAAALAGALWIFAVNQVRLASLFGVGAVRPEAFDFVHGVLWEAAMLAAVAACWIAWLGRGRRAARRGPLP